MYPTKVKCKKDAITQQPWVHVGAICIHLGLFGLEKSDKILPRELQREWDEFRNENLDDSTFPWGCFHLKTSVHVCKCA